ncbi:alpha/beta fold hydrolase [Stigmatella erecta]|uniref:Pimeloyl-ACP methyl ester carboxylesterase n=1 Tax=Stigmatella erecta TaxID=83460 RepID=A0A1I0D423_9BACT|nr:alpha/beta fold hydrolase [Stigmatella erecta]SET26970.1 Pimeloyl-ACP methyl ester carboxylesterase [Stigmatella erecta]
MPLTAGPIESHLLGQLAPVVEPRAHWLPGGGSVRVLEGGSGPPVVLLHGRGHAASMWFSYLTVLARGRRVLAVDLPGFGLSSCPEQRLRTGEDGVRFFTEPVEELLQVLAPGPVALVGHSLGGLVALELALRGKVPVERLVLIDAMGLGPAMTPQARLFFRAGPERLARTLGAPLFERLVPPPETPLGRRLGLLGHELLAVPEGRARATRAFNTLVPVVGGVFHRREQLASLRQPVLLVWGEREEMLPVSLAVEAAERFREARLLRVMAGHSPHLERPEVVLPALKAFLGDAPTGVPGADTAPEGA